MNYGNAQTCKQLPGLACKLDFASIGKEVGTWLGLVVWLHYLLEPMLPDRCLDDAATHFFAVSAQVQFNN